MPFEDNDEIKIDLRKYSRVMKKRKRIVLVITLIVVIIALIVNLRTPKLYEASLLFMITTNPTIKADLTGKIATFNMPALSVATYNNLITSPFLAAKVVEELAKQDSSFSVLTPTKLTATIGLKDIPGTTLMELTIRYISQDGAMKIANALANSFIEENVALSNTQHTQQLIADKLKIWKNNLENAENGLKNFNANSKLEVLNSRIGNITLHVTNNEDSIRYLTAAIKENEKLLTQIENQLKEQQPNLVTNRSITDDYILHQLSKDITKEEASKLNSLKVSSEELNPVYMNLLQRKVDLILQIADDKERLAGYREGLGSLKKLLAAANKESSTERLQLEQLTRNVDLSRDTYKLISQKNDELSISYTKDPGLLKIVREAYAPPSPVSPRVKRNTLIWGLFGLLLGGLVALLQEYLSLNKK